MLTCRSVNRIVLSAADSLNVALRVHGDQEPRLRQQPRCSPLWRIRWPRRLPSKTATKKRARPSAEVAASEAAHIHHWLIEAPNGPLSASGTCACGETREFRNSSEDSIWDRTEGRSRWNDMGVSRRRKTEGESN